MKIETRLDFKGYLKLMYILTYRKPTTVFVTVVGAIMFVTSILHFMGFNMTFDSPPYFQVVFGAFVVVVLPFSVYYSAKRNFTTHKNLQETICYEFTDDKILLKGETFNTEMDWLKVYKLREFNHWFLIYHNRQLANFISKEPFGNNLSDFKELVKRKGIKAKLKK